MVLAPSQPTAAQGLDASSARPCFLWSTARSGTNIVTAALTNSPDITCYNEDDPRAFEIFLLRDDETIKKILRDASTPSVFFKSFGDTPRAPHLMSLFPAAKAIYLVRKPVDTIASFVQEFGDMGREAWSTVFRSHVEGKPIHSFRNGGANTQKLDQTRALSARMVDLLDRYGTSRHNVAATLFLWQHSFQQIYGAGSAERVLLVKYSDFTQHPEMVFTKMCEWFGARPAFDHFPRLHQGRGSRAEHGTAHPALIERCEAIYEQICASDKFTHIAAPQLAPPNGERLDKDSSGDTPCRNIS